MATISIWPVKIEIPGMVPPSLNVQQREYRMPKAKMRLREEWARQMKYAVPIESKFALEKHSQNGQRMRVDIEVYLKRGYDPDNLVGAVKPCLDAMRQIRFIADDDEKHLVLLVRQFKSKEQGDKFHGTRIFIQPA